MFAIYFSKYHAIRSNKASAKEAVLLQDFNFLYFPFLYVGHFFCYCFSQILPNFYPLTIPNTFLSFKQLIFSKLVNKLKINKPRTSLNRQLNVRIWEEHFSGLIWRGLILAAKTKRHWACHKNWVVILCLTHPYMVSKNFSVCLSVRLSVCNEFIVYNLQILNDM